MTNINSEPGLGCIGSARAGDRTDPFDPATDERENGVRLNVHETNL
jgi:hypothetical protein